MKLKNSLQILAFSAIGTALAGQSFAQTTTVPTLNSRSNAAYTLYLDFGAFNYNVAWDNKVPGAVNAYDSDNNAANFSDAELTNIRQIWARTAEAYSVWNINVTTVDPAVAAGQAGSDLQRRTYYDTAPRLMHTVMGGGNAWYGPYGGVSYLSTAQYGNVFEGGHTNWAFSKIFSSGGNLRAIGEVAAHEDGHAMGAGHQHDENNRNTTYSTNGGSVGNGSFAPIMGNSYSSQRGLWRYGATGTGTAFQDDVRLITANPGLGGYVDAGIGHSLANATTLALTGTTVNSALAKGVITPNSVANSTPLGVANYTQDYFAFSTLGGAVTLKSNDGNQLLAPGVADPGASLDSELEILDLLGNVVGMGVSSTDTLSDTFTGNLAAGRYYARISSIGGYQSAYEANARYYTMGSYFLTGSGFTAVPEPATLAALAIGSAFLARRRRKHA